MPKRKRSAIGNLGVWYKPKNKKQKQDPEGQSGPGVAAVTGAPGPIREKQVTEEVDELVQSEGDEGVAAGMDTLAPAHEKLVTEKISEQVQSTGGVKGAHETQVTTEKIDSADTLAAVAAMIRREARRMAKNREKGKDTRAERRKTMVKVGVGLVVASVAVVVGMIENGEIDLGDDEEPEGEDEGEDGGEGSSEPEPVREVREDEDQGYRMRRISNWVQTAAQG